MQRPTNRWIVSKSPFIVFLLLILALFGFFSTHYQSIIVQFDVEANGFGVVQMSYTTDEQIFSSNDIRSIKLAPGSIGHARFEISAPSEINRLQFSAPVGGISPLIRNLKLLAPKSGVLEEYPASAFNTGGSGEFRAHQHAASGFKIEPSQAVEVAVPSQLYAQGPFLWWELGSLLMLMIFVSILIDGRRLRAFRLTGGADVSGYWLALACIALAALGAQKISYGSIVGDAGENLAIALNLLNHGVFSHLHSADLTPTNLREPLPPFFYATWLALVEVADHAMTLDHLAGASHAYVIKLGNIFWIYAGLVAFSKLIAMLTQKKAVQWIGLFLVFLVFFGNAQWTDTLYTELHAAVLLLWLAYFSVLSVEESSWQRLSATGLVAGLLVLTKAIFLYVFLVLIAAWFGMQWLRRNKTGLAHPKLRVVGLLVGAMLCVVASWALRNTLQFGSPSVSSVRGGGVMYFRAMQDEMNWEEIKGLLYLNGPSTYRRLSDALVGAPKRSDYQRDGRWARLYIGPSNFQTTDRLARQQGRPEDAVSFHQKSSAEFVKRIAAANTSGSNYPEREADQSMGRDAVQYFLQHPVRHLVMSAPFLWAGYWGFGSGYLHHMWAPPKDAWAATCFEAINLLAGLALAVCFFRALMKNKATLLAITAPSVLMLGAYTAVSQNLPRFFAPTHPLMILCLVLLFVRERQSKHDSISVASD